MKTLLWTLVWLINSILFFNVAKIYNGSIVTHIMCYMCLVPVGIMFSKHRIVHWSLVDNVSLLLKCLKSIKVLTKKSMDGSWERVHSSLILFRSRMHAWVFTTWHGNRSGLSTEKYGGITQKHFQPAFSHRCEKNSRTNY